MALGICPKCHRINFFLNKKCTFCGASLKSVALMLVIGVLALLTACGASESDDPRYDTCAEAVEAGYGPYEKGKDPEYTWYRDSDNSGTVCEG